MALNTIHNKHYLLSLTSALSAALVSSLLLLSLISYNIHQQQQVKTTKLLQLFETLDLQTKASIEQLNALNIQSCTTDNLLHMRRTLFQNSGIKDLGFISNNQLQCTTGLGLLTHPLQQSPADFLSSGGFEAWHDKPLLLPNDKQHAFIIRQGQYSAIINLQILQELDTAPFQWQLVQWSNNQPNHLAGQPHVYTMPDAMGSGFKQHNCQIDSSVCAYVYISQNDFMKHNKSLIILLFALVTIISVMTYRYSNRYSKRYFSIKERIRRGLKNGCFYPVYQPIVDLTSLDHVGCETLARFEDKQGSLMPDVFIPIINELKLTWPFTQHIIEKALSELNKQNHLNDGYRVAFNIFPNDITQNAIAELLHIPQVINSRFNIVLEIIESEALDTQNAQKNLCALHQAGITIAFDDFGTGYSNLLHIQDIHSEILKIDRSFVQHIEDSTAKQALISRIIDIAKDAKLQTVAEGVENLKQQHLLKKLGINYGQGWLYGKPMPATQLMHNLTLKKVA